MNSDHMRCPRCGQRIVDNACAPGCPDNPTSGDAAIAMHSDHCATTRQVFHGDKLVATIYGVLNDALVVPESMDWRSIAWPQQNGRDRYARYLTVLHPAAHDQLRVSEEDR